MAYFKVAKVVNLKTSHHKRKSLLYLYVVTDVN